jgi:LPXTG-motif cell wall-anchored protein
MSRTKNYSLILLGIASALGIVWLVRRRREEAADMKAWRQVLMRWHGAEKAGQLTEAVRQQRTVLIAEAAVPDNQALRVHLKENILPGLALYQVLLQECDGDQTAALAEVDEAFRAETLPKYRLLLTPLKVLPAPFRLFKFVFPQVMKQYPAEGWDIAYVENSDDKVAFNITRCFYLNTLTAYGAPELTAVFCKGDDMMAECFPPGIRFVRAHTLGRGDALCDFQYCRVEER